MTVTWKKRESWVAVFDVLGFRSLIQEADQEFPRALLTDQIAEVLESFDSDAARIGNIEFLLFSDTLVAFAADKEPKSYAWFIQQCKAVITDSIRVQLPLRGAISVGTTFTAQEHPIVLGAPFVEAFEYCEDQDWVGLLLAPSATRSIRSAGFEPLRHDFVAGPVPLRKLPATDVLAYRFQNGAANFECPLLPWLIEMQHFAPTHAKEKYSRTIEHIRRHYCYMRGQPARAEADCVRVVEE